MRRHRADPKRLAEENLEENLDEAIGLLGGLGILAGLGLSAYAARRFAKWLKARREAKKLATKSTAATQIDTGPLALAPPGGSSTSVPTATATATTTTTPTSADTIRWIKPLSITSKAADSIVLQFGLAKAWSKAKGYELWSFIPNDLSPIDNAEAERLLQDAVARGTLDPTTEEKMARLMTKPGPKQVPAPIITDREGQRTLLTGGVQIEVALNEGVPIKAVIIDDAKVEHATCKGCSGHGFVTERRAVFRDTSFLRRS